MLHKMSFRPSEARLVFDVGHMRPDHAKHFCIAKVKVLLLTYAT
jgi:hypothetical protein